MTDSLLPLLAAANDFNKALMGKLATDEVRLAFSNAITPDDWSDIAVSQSVLERAEAAMRLVGAGKEARDATYEHLAPSLIHISELYAQAARTVLGDAAFSAIITPEQHSADRQQGLAAQNAPVLASAFAP